MKVLPDHGLAPYHTFGIDAVAAQIVEAESIDDFVTIWRDSNFNTMPKLVVGQGSNLLFCEDYQGVIILNRIKGIALTETATSFCLHVGGGEDWHQLVSWCVKHNIGGLENLALIPGCVGSSPIQNIGAYGIELKDVCQYVDVLDVNTNEVKRYDAAACQFGYRDSIFKHQLKDGHIIVAVGFCLSKQWHPQIAYAPLNQFDATTVTIQQVFDAVCDVRKAKLPDPCKIGNAGSFFKNPIISKTLRDKLLVDYPSMPSYGVDDQHVKLAAGWLIDQCGLKGYQIGGAKIHPQQALVLTNIGTATAEDVIYLAQYVVDSVVTKFGVGLEHEVRFMAANAETHLSEILAS
ncbi:UDP-N-acetylmuramate dehydrogenase [Photobacterium phosphoreum]|uniref:UDP-N-acetylmuramate dehydrogenase n=1 Tax=Photobacterium phosphoreum TaxID=659 RepID=UPI000D1650BE|nr:UDP-N-acetylmuramate dehydrogenase [Photobacterium phosphoreum]PSU68438.1 UDP-N-acetylenolpyruvoylglucosamine reductase [Photobacterium phosphoreum]PTB32046.1 UDP-N-acetylenolpyruvoylglucosamine reductase [Photobacterium phosphoreum]